MLAVAANGREYAIEFGMGLPNHSGYLQTPAGGMPGTASPKRPTLAEIELERGDYRWFGASVDFRRGKGNTNEVNRSPALQLRLRYSAVGNDARAVLDKAFTIRGGVFEPGDTVRSRVSFDSLALALYAVFDFSPGLSAALGGEVGWTAFDFTMEGDRHRSERAYHVSTVGLAASVRKKLGGGWQLTSRLAVAPAVEGTGSRYAIEARVCRDLSARTRVALGALVEEFRYDDAHKQALPNRLQVTRRVLPTVSVELRL